MSDATSARYIVRVRMRPVVLCHDLLVTTLDKYGEVSLRNVENALRDIGADPSDMEEWEVVEQL